jgi:hypothetical protein
MPRTKKEKKKVARPPEKTEERIEESKYFVPQIAETKPRKKDFDFPHSYGENKIVLLVRDPQWVHAYWEITPKKYDEARDFLGGVFGSSREVLRVHDASMEPWKSFDIDTSYGARNWYINVPESNRTYVVDIGFLAPDGRFFLMARSNAVTTPRSGMSDVIDEEWMTVDFERIYALSGGFGIGKSSGEIKKLMAKYLLTQKASGWISSPSSPFGRSRSKGNQSK